MCQSGNWSGPLDLGLVMLYVGYVVGIRYIFRHKSFLKTIMQLTKSFPPADAFVEMIQEIDYKKHYNNYMDFVINVCAIVAAVSTILWEKIQVMKFRTPDFLSDYVYFSVNMICEPGDEIVGFSVGNRYVGLYNNGIAWGVLNAQGALDNR